MEQRVGEGDTGMTSLDNQTKVKGDLSDELESETIQPTEDGLVTSKVEGATCTSSKGDNAEDDSTRALLRGFATDTPVGGATASDDDTKTLPTVSVSGLSVSVATTSVKDGTESQSAEHSKIQTDLIKKTLNVNSDTVNRILGTIFGQCVGDAIGLLTEFLTKKECKEHYKAMKKELEFSHKIDDCHRTGWKTGDWTDDSDQMILIFLSIIENHGTVDPFDFAKRIKDWGAKGFPELGDNVGMGQGRTTYFTINRRDFLDDPYAAAERVWTRGDKTVASNGAVMRTSIIGVHMYADIDFVMHNAANIARTTHADPRCRASAVAVCVAIALMLQRQPQHLDKKGNYNIKAIINECYDYASKYLETDEKKKELMSYLKCTKLKELKLDESGKIGYTYKTMGSGFWALKQDNFGKAITKLIMEGGDADTNGAVAGAMLGCKLRVGSIPTCWTQNLLHKEWLETIIDRYFHMMKEVHNIDFTPYWTGHLS
ncbi:ADP-ribosyl-[dinitrogen reductase] glycohydrolase-like [Pecten maximus]|uniref:ADP-ribosyl-[dinitrogen reductase] glycohydrolase-like n=1 Tax=Pecten maximus TaxID=6579 RepID=UPI0014585ED5|nr:ADP-ribosyl-[dinitrogen reductase] glycohydrolase-like [Pecten maximus]